MFNKETGKDTVREPETTVVGSFGFTPLEEGEAAVDGARAARHHRQRYPGAAGRADDGSHWADRSPGAEERR